MLGLMEKNRFRQFLSFVAKYDKDDPKTHDKLDLNTMTAAELYKYFKLTDNAVGFTGHAIALYVDDTYLTKPALDLVLRSQLYAWSVQRYGTSPYLYPKYGLGGMPEGFSRRAAVYGGTFMLNMSGADPFVQQIHYDGNGKVSGITLGAQVVAAYDLKTAFIKTKQLVADPTYFVGTPKVEKTGEIARCIAILDHPIPDTNEADSCQLILPANQCGRQSDIYVCMTSDKQHVASKGKYVAVISGNVEGANNDPNVQLAPAFEFIGKVLEKFTWVSEVYKPTEDGHATQCFISSSMDATTHFQSSTLEVLDLYERITGKKVDLTPDPAGAADEAKAEPEPEPDVEG
jgi:Rab GDP dissociation inhibitor